MTVHGGDAHPAEDARVDALRAELDELLTARQYAVQRERRLAAALKPPPPGEHRYQVAVRQPDPDLLRQLTEVRGYREQLGARCRVLTRQLEDAEARVRESALRGHAESGLGDVRQEDPPSPPAAAAKIRRPIGARFGGARLAAGEEPAAPAVSPVPVASAALPVGARFGGLADEAEQPGPAAGADPQRRQGGHGPAEGQHPTGEQAGPGPADIAALAARVRGLYVAGDGRQAADLVAEAAVTLAPAEVAALAARLRADGPPGSANYLARAAVRGTAEHVALTLTLLRHDGSLGEQAEELFHQLWSWPAGRLVPLIAALEQSGQAADAATLLWESASAPPAEVAGLAIGLAAAGRHTDLRSLLGQAATRAAREVADILAALASAEAYDQTAALLGATVRTRQAGDVAQLGSVLLADGLAEPYGQLLEAAAQSTAERRRDIAAALRLAGLPLQGGQGRSRGRRGR